MNKSNLYFIALIPEKELREEVRRLKEDFKERFHAKHALKSPAHITLQRPFRREEQQEEKIIKSLKDFSIAQDGFGVDLCGFGCFEPRVIFIKVKEHKEITELHKKLNRVLLNDMVFLKKEMNEEIHPHVTLATRDLDKQNFYKAWQDYKMKDFKAYFDVKSIFLLKHNGKFWDIYMEFPFH